MDLPGAETGEGDGTAVAAPGRIKITKEESLGLIPAVPVCRKWNQGPKKNHSSRVLPWIPSPASLACSFKLQLLFAENKTQGRKTQLTRASLAAGKWQMKIEMLKRTKYFSYVLVNDWFPRRLPLLRFPSLSFAVSFSALFSLFFSYFSAPFLLFFCSLSPIFFLPPLARSLEGFIYSLTYLYLRKIQCINSRMQIPADVQ